MSLPPAIFPSSPSNAPLDLSDPVIFQDVAIGFEEKLVLESVSFRLPRGETRAIFGVAGSGKSTILKLTLGLLKADRGTILTLDQDINQLKEEDLFELRRRVGI